MCTDEKHSMLERARVTKLSCTVKFSGFEKGPFSSDSVVQFLEEMRRKYKNVVDDTKHKRVSKLTGVNVVVLRI